MGNDKPVVIPVLGRPGFSLGCLYDLSTHTVYVRKLWDTRVLANIYWVDTRDIYADGLTIGSVDIDALHSLMNVKCLYFWVQKQKILISYLPSALPT